MQVTHQEDHINHVMITNEKPIEFGISNSAEFFSILSSTLYKDQKLAVVRETLCNAWDIHIEGEITNVPVEVTVDDEKIVILDHGKGIHKNDMGLIYGTYGNSTKKNDGTQTGGFGLGCKSPFAYTDHFDVESSHDGKRTIYNLSKSSGQVMGKPTINPIVTVPTQESGLKVTIPIKAIDKRRFIELFKRISQNGDMNVLLNGEKSEDPLKMDLSKGFIITNRSDLADKPTTIMVRYGNVIYPVDQHDEYHDSYSYVTNHLYRISRGNGNYRIIFQAKPHSIAVTPSREELSMQVHTVQALKEIFENFVKEIEKNFNVEAEGQIKEIIVKAVERQDFNALLHNGNELPYSEQDKNQRAKLSRSYNYNSDSTQVDMTAWPEQVKHWLMTGYPDFGNFHKTDMNLRLSEMVRQKVGDVQLIKSYIEALKLAENSAYLKSHWVSHDKVKFEYNWLGRVVLAPLMVKIQQAGFNYKNLYVYEPSNNWGTMERDDQRSDFPLLAPADQARSKSLFDSIGYLKKIVVFTSARSKLLKRVENDRGFQKLIGREYSGQSSNGNCWLYYQVSKKTGELDAVKKIFKDAGYNIVDLMDVQPWESGYRDPALPKVKAPPKPKGIPNFFNVIWDHNLNKERNIPNIKLPTQTMEPLRIEKPKAVTAYGVSGSERYHPKFNDSSATALIASMFGKDIGVCLLQKTYIKWIGTGVPDIYDYVLDQVISYMKQSKTIAEYYSISLERIRSNAGMDSEEVSLMNLVWRHPLLKGRYGIKDNRTKEDHDYEELFKWFAMHGNDKAKKAVEEVNVQLKNIPVNTRLLEMVKYAKGSRWIRSLNIMWFSKQLDEAITSTAKTEELIEYMQDLLNRA